MSKEQLQEVIGGTSQQVSPEMWAFYGRVHRIRKEAENLLQFVDEIRKALNHRNTDFRQREAQAVVAASQNVVDHNIQQITDYIKEAKDILDNNPVLDATFGDNTVEIENAAEVLQLDWPKIILEIENLDNAVQIIRPAAIDLSELSARLDRVDTTLNKLWSLCGMVTAPSRVRQHLEQLRPGRVMNFHLYFKDEIPDANIRAKVLRYLSEHPKLINGVVNVETGDIYGASPDKSTQLLSFGKIALAPLLVFLLVTGLFYIRLTEDTQQWPFQRERLPDFILECVFVFLGGLVHLIVDFVKQDRASKGTAVLSLEDWKIWVHVQEASFIKGGIFLMLGAVALFWLFPTVEWKMAFFVGYSIDSFLDIFLLRFTTFASQGIADTEQKIKL